MHSRGRSPAGLGRLAKQRIMRGMEITQQWLMPLSQGKAAGTTPVRMQGSERLERRQAKPASGATPGERGRPAATGAAGPPQQRCNSEWRHRPAGRLDVMSLTKVESAAFGLFLISKYQCHWYPTEPNLTAKRSEERRSQHGF